MSDVTLPPLPIADLFAHELLDNSGGIWLGCHSRDVTERAYTEGETGKEVREYFTAAQMQDYARTALQAHAEKLTGSAPGPSGWRDIGSAPKDGTDILIAVIEPENGYIGHVERGHFEFVEEDEEDGPWDIRDGEPWCSYEGRSAGLYWCYWSSPDDFEPRGLRFLDYSDHAKYTHWMRLPPASGNGDAPGVARMLTEAQYREKLARVEALVRLDPELGTVEGDEIDRLADEIAEYEKAHFPLDEPSGEIVDFGSDTSKFREHLESLGEPELLAQQITQQGAVHALKTLLENGGTKDVATAMLESLHEHMTTIEAVAKSKGVKLLFSGNGSLSGSSGEAGS